MKFNYYTVTLVFFIISLNNTKAQFVFPKTAKINTVNTYHNIKISDDYRWLENLDSLAVKEWVKNQNIFSKKYLNKQERSIGAKWSIKKYLYNKMDFDDDYSENINNLYDAEENDKETNYFKLMYSGRNSLASIYYKNGFKGDFEKLISPNSISNKDQIIFNRLYPSKNGRFLAYQYSRNGSDWSEIKIVQIKKRHYFKEVLKNVVSSEIKWFGQGFFYKDYKFSSIHGKREFPKIKYHQLGTEQKSDKIIFESESKKEELDVYGTPDQSLYIVKKSNSFTKMFSFYFKESNSSSTNFKPIFENIKYDIDFLALKNDTVFAITRVKQHKYLFSFPLNQPKKWKFLSPIYKKTVLTSYELLDDKIVLAYQGEQSSFLTILNYDGKVLGEVATPEGLSISGLQYSEMSGLFYFKLSSYTVPPVTCSLDIENYNFEYLGKLKVAFNAKDYKFLKKNFTSHDGVKVPMFIVYKDTLNLVKGKPFLLKTYGGYGTVASPSYDPGVIHFIESGGAYAYVNVRGGGEFGLNWWEEGKKMKKKNSILDFTYAAKYLVENGFTKKKKIAITGTSHGGLVAAGALIEEPELFGAAVIDVGVLDMLRFENSAVGSKYTNINEFGTIHNKKEFLNLLSYSPYHTIKEGVNYPSTLIVTGSDDNRVPAYHSYKFVAKLQSNPNQLNPILLWSQDKTGHFGANNYNSIIEERAFIYGFLFNELVK